MGKRNSERLKFNQIYTNYVNQYIAKRINNYVYDNLPSTIEPDFIEKMLINYGQIAFTQLDDNIYTVGSIIPINYSQIDYYPLDLRVQFFGKQSDVKSTVKPTTSNESINMRDKKEVCVIIKDNSTNYIPIIEIQNLCEKLTRIDIAIEVALKKSSNPILIFSNEDNVLSSKIIGEQIEENQATIYLDGSFENKINKLDLGGSQDLLQLFEVRKQLIKILENTVGVNSECDKKERMLASEIDKNSEMVDRLIDTGYFLRKQAINTINKVFGLNIKVYKYTDLIDIRYKKLDEESSKVNEYFELNNF